MVVLAYVVALVLLLAGTVLVVCRDRVAARLSARHPSRPVRAVGVLWVGIAMVVVSAPIGAAVIVQLRGDVGASGSGDSWAGGAEAAQLWVNILVLVCVIAAPIGLASLMPLARERAQKDPGSVALPVALGVIVGMTALGGIILVIGFI